MKALALNGSPRKNGNTAALLEKVLSPLIDSGWETELVQIGGKKIQGCRGCLKCAEMKNKRCVFDNDILNGVLEKMLAADAIILGTPCYFADMSAEMKALVDRAGYVAFVNDGLFQGKIGAAVVAVGRGGATHAFDSINHLFLMSRMLVPGSSFWNMGYGSNEKDVLGDSLAMENMRHLGRTIAWLGEATAPHMASFPA
ncbi:MAG: FMN reductase [Desulfovibrio sp. MES5]|uniref:flavodoxin family protein n=1 Tax=Desulfovibrio sp. MES5 TaxID=1899016 RepID=UPI000B9D3D36|nr:flavodoxin family protein [Desulfovibrio sp. MES5]OXS28611.1 MAG: FMN reductase [Desulfovibrio sp. MES5]